MNNTSTEVTHHKTSQERVIRQGFGTNFYDNGQIEFEGEWQDNLPEGEGTYFDEHTTPLFIGIWKKGKPSNGKRYTNLDMYTDRGNRQHYCYMGNFNDDKRNGFGTLFNKDKTKIYEGLWKDDKRHGQGTSFNAKGRPIFTGEWKNDKPCIDTSIPDDTAISVPGDKKRVMFNLKEQGYKILKGTHYTGKVIKYHPSGSKSYEGDLDYGKRHGQGTSFNEKGVRLYTGEWKDDKRHGQGISFHQDGTVEHKCRWENDEHVQRHPSE